MADPLNPGRVERFFRRLYSAYCLILKVIAVAAIVVFLLAALASLLRAAGPQPWCTNFDTGEKYFCNDPSDPNYPQYRSDDFERWNGHQP